MSIETSPPATAPPVDKTGGGANSAATTTVCQNCQTSTTPLWRRDESGQVLCNACGLFLKLHGRNRPISLKTDVIKSRNRSRSTHANHLKASSNKHHLHHQQQQLHQQHRTTGPPPVHHIAMAPYGIIPPHMQYPMPTTPSTVFSYPNSPTLAPVNRYVINSTPASLANSPRLNPYHHPSQQTVPPTLLPPPRNVQTAHNSPAVTPVGGRSPLPSLASLAHVSHAPSAPPPQAQPQQQPVVVVAQPPPPQPQPQPQMPQAPQAPPPASELHHLHHLSHHIPIHHHHQHNIHQPRNVMSEQLRPHSPDGLERIPALKMEYGGRRASSSYSSPQSKPVVNGGGSGAGEKSRVTELELVNDLLRSRVTQLEQAEAAAREQVNAAREEVNAARARIAELERQVEIGTTSKRAAAATTAADSASTITTTIQSDKMVTQEPQVKRIRVSDML